MQSLKALAYFVSEKKPTVKIWPWTDSRVIWMDKHSCDFSSKSEIKPHYDYEMKKRKRKRKREKKERKGKARTYLLLSSPTLEALKEGATQPRLSLLMQANLNLNWNRFKDVKCVNREMMVNIEIYYTVS